MEYSIKKQQQRRYRKFWNYNIPKKVNQTKICKILEYGIFHGIFLEYSKKSTTTIGGVKFNHDRHVQKTQAIKFRWRSAN